MATPALRKEVSVTAHNLHALNLLYLINALAYKPKPLHEHLLIPVKTRVSADGEAEPDPAFC